MLSGVRRNIRDKAFRAVEYLGAQIIEEKLLMEFGPERSVPLDQTSEASDTGGGAGEDDVAAAGAKKGRAEKGILSEVINLSDDDEVSKWDFFFCFL